MNNNIKNILNVLIGLTIAALSFNLFIAPNHLVTGGVDGISIIVNTIIPINKSLFILIINIFLILLSFIILGPKKTINTIFGAIAYPIIIGLTSHIVIEDLSNLDPLIIAMLAGIFSGIGYGLVYKSGFSSGGTDILNLIFEQQLKIPISKAIIYIDGGIVLLSSILFGFQNTIYSLISLILLSYFSNKILISLGNKKMLYILTSKVKEIKKFLNDSYSYDVTIINTHGGFTLKVKKLLMCSVETKNYYAIKEGILLIDPDAFVTITNTYEEQNANRTLRKNQESIEKINTSAS